ncbi:hypothetical protein [Kineococcus auxinigenes]|uniref:hypothetical protein n=1 Tax=unclassified Kineococcus TaxID=2621656 RepID=UPI003D7C439C
MATIATNNPAGRLHALFTALLRGTNAQARNATKLGAALGKVWDLDWPEDHRGIAIRVVDALVLPEQIEEQISAWADDPRVYEDLALEHLGAWRQALRATTNLDNTLLSLTQHLNDTNLQGLQIASRALSTVAPEVQPADDDLERLAESVAALLQEVFDADLDEEVRAFLVDQLRLMQDAIARVRVRGVQALYDAFDQVAGATRFRRRQAADRLRREEPDLAQKFWALLTNLATVVTLVQGGVALTADLGDLLPLQSATATTEQEPAAPTAPEAPVAPDAASPSPADLPSTSPHGPAQPSTGPAETVPEAASAADEGAP